jgi:hypothetical protein
MAELLLQVLPGSEFFAGANERIIVLDDLL